MKNKIIIIAGPTASGKTAISLELAKEFNGEIVSADSMQVYKTLDINTAKATVEEQNIVKHHLIDVVRPEDNFDVTTYTALAKEAINDIISRGKTPIIVGGTGMYIKSLLYTQSFGGAEKDESIRKKYTEYLKEFGPVALHDLLKKVDPISAEEIHPNNTKRVIRALEIYDITGKTKSSQKDSKTPANYDYLMFVLDIPRETLYERINLRVSKMIELGGVQEAKMVQSLNLEDNSQCLQAIGYKEFFPYLDGQKTLEQVTEDLSKATRNYAKRQLTYFRSFVDAKWYNPLSQKNEIIKAAKEFLCCK